MFRLNRTIRSLCKYKFFFRILDIRFYCTSVYYRTAYLNLFCQTIILNVAFIHLFREVKQKKNHIKSEVILFQIKKILRFLHALKSFKVDGPWLAYNKQAETRENNKIKNIIILRTFCVRPSRIITQTF